MSAPFMITVARPASSLTSRRSSLPTVEGSTCWYRSVFFCSAATWSPALWAKAADPT